MVKLYKIKVLPWIIGTLIFLIWPQVVFSSTSIEWKKEVLVTEPRVVLSDLAYIAGDPQRVAVLQNIEMGAAPEPGQTRYFTPDIIQTRLQAQGIHFQAEGWTLPNMIVVTAESQVIPHAYLRTEVEKAIMKTVPYAAEDVTFVLRGNLSDLTIADGDYRIETKFPNGIRYTGPTTVVVEIRMVNGTVRNLYLTYDIRAVTSVCIVKKAVGARQFLSTDDVTQEKRSVASLPIRALKDSTLLDKHWVKRSLAAGTILTEDMLDIPPAVRKQNQVTIRVNSNGVRIDAYGIALQDGRPGDIIRVQNIDSKRTLSARVIDKTTVQPLGL